jgi:hypothetical protein
MEDNLRRNASFDEKEALQRQLDKKVAMHRQLGKDYLRFSHKNNRQFNLFTKYIENPEKKHKGLYMEKSLCSQDGFNMKRINEIKTPDPKLSNFAKAYRLAQRRYDKAAIKTRRVEKKEEDTSRIYPPNDNPKWKKARNITFKHAHKYGSRLDNLGANGDNSQREMLFKQSDKALKRLSKGKPSRRLRMLDKYANSTNTKKHKGLYMEWQLKLGNLILESSATLSAPAKRYKQEKKLTNKLSDSDPKKAYVHFLSAKYYRSKIKKNPERVKARGK